MTSQYPNLILLGLRGSGKTTLGRGLAQALHRPFVDLDDRTAAVTGQPSVAEAWTEVGERGFRNAETRALKRLLAERGRVIALGGGTPTAPGAADALRDSQASGDSILIYLRARPDTLRQRLQTADLSDRPSLTGTDTISEIDLIHARRDGLYQDLADEILQVDGLDQRSVLRELRQVARS